MTQIQLRPAVPKDVDIVLRWPNDPFISVRSAFQREVEWTERLNWFGETLGSNQRQMLIILLHDQPIGLVQFEFVHDNQCTVSIYLLPEYTGQGHGVAALKIACWKLFGDRPVAGIAALIQKTNSRSISAFQKAGFKSVDQAAVEVPPDHLAFYMERPTEVPHNRLTWGDSEVLGVADVVRSGYWASGPRVAKLETTLAHMANVKSVVCVASGLSALRLLLLGLGIKPGDKVLIPAYSCVALANAVLACGAAPVPVEIAPDDWNIDVRATKDAVYENRPKAIIAVNTFGLPSSVESIQQFEVPVVEDCSHGFGLTVNGVSLGGRSAAAILSFSATKLVGGGQGGAILSSSPAVGKFVESWRDYNDKPPDGKRLNEKMTDLEAALAQCQLNRLAEMIAARYVLAKRYHDLLVEEASHTGSFRLPNISEDRIWYRYAVEMRTASAQSVIDSLGRLGVRTAIPVTDWRSTGMPLCPVSDRAYHGLVSLPLYPTLTQDEQDRVVHAFLAFVREHA